MKTSFKRAAAWLLTVLMILSCVPALAEEGITSYSDDVILNLLDTAESSEDVQEDVGTVELSDQAVVTIQYQFGDGSQAAQPVVKNVKEDGSLQDTVTVPTITGYQPVLAENTPAGVSLDSYTITLNLTNVTDAVTVVVVYNPALVNYTVKYYQQTVDGAGYELAGSEIKQGYTGATVGANLDVTAVGETFTDKYEGFYSRGYDEDLVINADGSTVVEIRYDRRYYLITFDLGGGYGVDPIYAPYGAAINVNTNNLKRPGYTFNGWDKDIPETMPIDGGKFTAQWEAGTVTFTIVTWYENANDKEYSYAGSKTDTALPGTVVSSSTYRTNPFDGHDSTHFTYNSSKAETVTVNGDGSTVLNVYFTRNVYKVTFTYTDGPFWNEKTYTCQVIEAKYQADIGDQWPLAGETYGSYTTVPENLIGWDKVNGSTQVTKLWTMTEGLCSNSNNGKTLTAVTSDNTNKYNVYYWLESLDGTGTLYNNTYYKKSEEYSQELVYKKYQATWGYKDIDGFEGITNQADNSSNTFNLYYKRNRHTIKFVDNYGTTVATITNVMFGMPLNKVMYNGESLAAIVPAYPGDLETGAYKFDGWYTTAGCYDGTEADFDSQTMPDADLIYYAKWIPVQHTVKVYLDYECNNEELLRDETVDHGKMASTVVLTGENKGEYAEEGYTFVGWFYNDNGVEKAFDFKSMQIRKDMVIYGKWSYYKPVKYVVRYVYQNGDTLLDVASPLHASGLVGDLISLEPKTGDQLYPYYQGCFTPMSVNGELRLVKNEGENVFVFYYQENQVTYTYTAVCPDSTATDFGSVSRATETVNVVTGNPQGSTPTAGERYRFDGWYTDADCSIPVSSGVVVGADNKLTPAKTNNVYTGGHFYAKFVLNVTDITIKKVVDGNMGDRFKEFTFVINAEQLLAEGETPVTTLKLANNGSGTLKNVVLGSTITITESDNTGYEVSVKVNNANDYTALADSTYTGTVTDGMVIEFKNFKDGTPDTGVVLDSLPYIVILAIVLLGVVLMVRKRRREDD